ncbi:hypothetical protein D3C84_887010 [compost metagenome]
MIADGGAIQRIAVDQQLPGLLTGIDVEQLQGDLVDLGDAQFLQQLLALFRGFQPGLQVFGAEQLVFVEDVLEARHVEHAQGDAGAFENILIAPATFTHLALTTAYVQQGDQRQQRERQPQQAFTDKRRQQFFDHTLPVEQPAQLPVAAGQGDRQHAVGHIIRGQLARLGQGL